MPENVNEATHHHTRDNSSLTASVEKRILVWMARRMPSRVNLDHLTLLGLVAMFLAGLSFWAAQWAPYALFAVVVCLGLNWLGDSLDGTLARVRDRQRPRYGFYVDHIVDVFGAAFLMVGLALSPYMSLMVGLGLLLVYLMLSARRSIWRRTPSASSASLTGSSAVQSSASFWLWERFTRSIIPR